ncbi:MAG: GtrA family protein [Acidobacteriota bacterium]
MTEKKHCHSAFGRWVGFNLVGVPGVIIQLSVLTLLTLWGAHYLAATALAVEAAVLHNFAWHRHWTWRDRTKGDKASFSRLVRFNLTVGVVSIAQNLFLMKILVDHFAIHYLPANVASIVICSLMNFLVSDRFVFCEIRSPLVEENRHGSITRWLEKLQDVPVCVRSGCFPRLLAGPGATRRNDPGLERIRASHREPD